MEHENMRRWTSKHTCIVYRTVAQNVARVVAGAVLVVGPQGRLSRSGHKAADHHLHWDHLKLLHDGDVGIGGGQHRIGHDVCGVGEPPC